MKCKDAACGERIPIDESNETFLLRRRRIVHEQELNDQEMSVEEEIRTPMNNL